MGGFSNINGDPLGTIVNADNISFDGTARGAPVTTNGQLLIGSTVAPHIRIGTLSSSDGSVTITPGNGTIDLKAASGKSSPWVLIQTLAASSSSSLNFTTGITNTYNAFILVATNAVTSTTAFLYVRLSTDGGSTYLSSSYLSGVSLNNYNASTFTNQNATAGFIIATLADNSHAMSSTTYLMNLTSGSTYPNSFGDGSEVINTGCTRFITSGCYTSAITVNALQVIPSSGTITSGNFSLYGLLQ
jgi:hypothetical protein